MNKRNFIQFKESLLYQKSEITTQNFHLMDIDISCMFQN